MVMWWLSKSLDSPKLAFAIILGPNDIAKFVSVQGGNL